jgi:hypothetical protein
VEPALAALVRRARVPGDAERLQPPAREADQVLLQRRPAEGVGDGITRGLAVRAVGVDPEFVAVTVEARGDAVGGEFGVVEVAEDVLRRRLGHGQVVVGALPGGELGGVAGAAARAADIAVGGGLVGGERRRSGQQHAKDRRDEVRDNRGQAPGGGQHRQRGEGRAPAGGQGIRHRFS